MLSAAVLVIASPCCKRDGDHGEDPRAIPPGKTRGSSSSGGNSPGQDDRAPREARSKEGTYSSEILKGLREEPDFLSRELAKMGPGLNRTKWIASVLNEVAKADPPLELEKIRELMLMIDGSPFPGDRAGLSNGTLTAIIGKLKLQDSVSIMSGFSSRAMKSTWAYAIGSSMAEADKSLSGKGIEALKGLGAWDRTSVLVPYAQTLHFQSAAQMSAFFAGLPLSEEERKEAAEAAANSASNLQPREMLAEGLKHQGDSLGPVFFQQGFAEMYQRDSTEASKYLVESRDSMPKAFYRQAVGHMVEKLKAAGDQASADAWKKELQR